MILSTFGGDTGRSGRSTVGDTGDLLRQQFCGGEGVLEHPVLIQFGELETHDASTRLTTMWETSPVLGLVHGRGGPTISSSRPSAMTIWSAAVRSVPAGKYPRSEEHTSELQSRP